MKWLLVLPLLLLAAPVLAVEPAVKLIPEKISANESFILQVDPKTSDSVRIFWQAHEFSAILGDYAAGQVPKVGSTYYCFFSKGNFSNCGPSPFISPSQDSPTHLNVTVFQSNLQSSGVSYLVGIGSAKFDPRISVLDNGSVMMFIYTTALPLDRINYNIYREDLSEVPSASGALKPDPSNPNLHTLDREIVLQDGVYYVALSGSSSSTYGGTVVRIAVGQSAAPSLGTSQLRAEKISYQAIVEPGKPSPPKTNFRLINQANATVSNISIQVPDEYKDVLVIRPDSTSLSPGGETFLSVVLQNLNSAMDINTKVPVFSNKNKVGQIDVEIDVGLTQAAVQAGSKLFSVTDPVWKASYLVGQENSMTFTLVNNGENAIDNVTVSLAGLEGVVTYNPVPLVIAPYSSEQISFSALSDAPAQAAGVIDMQTAYGSDKIYVDLDFFPDSGSDIESESQRFQKAKTALSSTQRTPLSGVLTSIEQSLSTAKSDYNAGRYDSANALLMQARAQTDVIEKLGSPSNVPPSGINGSASKPPISAEAGFSPLYAILIIAVLAVGALAAVIVYKKKKQESSGSWQDDEGY